MSHLDEGTLHALLDGELETTEVAEIQAHLGSCASCGLRLREVKEFLAEADRLVAAVELGARPAAAVPPPAAREAPRPEPIARPEPPPRREPPARPRAEPSREPWNEPPPVLLIPDNESAADRRMRRLRKFGWAALFVGMVGAGFLGVSMRPKTAVMGPLPSRSTVAESDAVMSPEEGAPRADEAAAPPESSALALRDKPSTTITTTASPTPPANSGERQLASAKPKQAPAPARESRLEQADAQTIDSLAESTSVNNQAADSAATDDIDSVRVRAAEALADLDRERRLKQAAAATAALDAERSRRAAAAATRPAAVRPRV